MTEIEEEVKTSVTASTTLSYPATVNALELDIMSCDEFLPQGIRMFAKKALLDKLKEAVSHENCCELVVSAL